MKAEERPNMKEATKELEGSRMTKQHSYLHMVFMVILVAVLSFSTK